MGRQNIAFMYARVHKEPIISRDKETGEYNYGMVYVDTVRGLRSVEDDVRYVKHDHPLIMSREKEHLDKMSEWKENDIVYIKGVVTTKTINKTSYCPNCTDAEGNATKNVVKGNFVYITPIFSEKVKSYGEDKVAAKDDLVNHREIGNQLYVLGTLVKEPKLITTKRGIQITQYPIALNRKFTIRTDDPNIRTDWPIVKPYGERAREDKIYLQLGADILLDGFIQARTVHRKMKCPHCEQEYVWDDHSMELVAYDVEYVSGHKSREQVEAEAQQSVEDLKQKLFDSGYKDTLDDNLRSDDTEDGAETV